MGPVPCTFTLVSKLVVLLLWCCQDLVLSEPDSAQMGPSVDLFFSIRGVKQNEHERLQCVFVVQPHFSEFNGD